MNARILLSLVIALVLAACKSGGGAADIDTSLPGDPAAGAEVYGRICVACHGADGRGNGGLGGDFIGEPQRLQQDNAVLINTITNGVTRNNRVMPAQGAVLTEQEIKNVLSYVRQQFGS